jgi:hypothetical protein
MFNMNTLTYQPLLFWLSPVHDSAVVTPNKHAFGHIARQLLEQCAPVVHIPKYQFFTFSQIRCLITCSFSSAAVWLVLTSPFYVRFLCHDCIVMRSFHSFRSSVCELLRCTGTFVQCFCRDCIVMRSFHSFRSRYV